MKYVERLDDREGVLFGVPLKADHPRSVRLGHPPHVTIQNVGKCRFLRVGTKAYNFPYVLNVLVDGREILSQTISEKTWSDLKVDLQATAADSPQVTLELFIPPDQKYLEGVWFDYIDFFED